MRFADVYATTIAQATDDLTKNLSDQDIRLAALRWKLSQATAAFVNATGPNPAMNALDMLVLVTLSRMVVEDYQTKVLGEPALPLLEAHRKLETDAWTLASRSIRPAQQQELRGLIQEWREKNPDQRYIGAIRFREFVTALGRSPRPENTSKGSIFSLLFMDPLAGLDSTTAAIEETRLLGERAMYYSQRMPMLLSWQTELLAYQLAAQPESKQMLADAGRFVQSAESLVQSANSVAKTAEQLPAVIDQQRQAAIQQVLDAWTTEEAKIRGLLADSRDTFGAANEMAKSVDNAVESLTEFVRQVSPPTVESDSAPHNSKPFDVLEYGKAADQIGAAARDLNGLLATLKATTPQLDKLSQQATAEADRLVERGARAGLMLIAVLLVGSIVAGLVYRLLARKVFGT